MRLNSYIMKKMRSEYVLRKQPIISERKNTKDDASLCWTQKEVDATDKNTKDNVSNIK